MKRGSIRDASRSIFLPFILALLSSLPWVFRASLSSVHRETEHVFCFSPPVCFRQYIRAAEEPCSSFSIQGMCLSKDNTTKQFSKVFALSRNVDLESKISFITCLSIKLLAIFPSFIAKYILISYISEIFYLWRIKKWSIFHISCKISFQTSFEK